MLKRDSQARMIEVARDDPSDPISPSYNSLTVSGYFVDVRQR